MAKIDDPIAQIKKGATKETRERRYTDKFVLNEQIKKGFHEILQSAGHLT